MRPSPNLCAISPLHNSVAPDTAMSALQIPQSLKIRCLCINDNVGSYTNLWRLLGNRPVLWSLQYLFTYPTLSSLFHILSFKHTYHSNTSIFYFRPYFIHLYQPHYYLFIHQNRSCLCCLLAPRDHVCSLGCHNSQQPLSSCHSLDTTY